MNAAAVAWQTRSPRVTFLVTLRSSRREIIELWFERFCTLRG